MNPRVSVQDFVPVHLLAFKGPPQSRKVVCSLSFGHLPTVPFGTSVLLTH